MIPVRFCHASKKHGRELAHTFVVVLAITCIMWISSESMIAQSSTQQAVKSVSPSSPTQRGSNLAIRQLTTRSEVVAIGTVTGLQSEWNTAKTGIITHATVRVNEYVKGNPGQTTVTITYPGGEVGKEGELYSHSVSFQKNEEVLIFARKDSEGNYKVLDGDQGKLRVTKDLTTGRKMVSATMSIDDIKLQVKEVMKTQENK